MAIWRLAVSRKRYYKDDGELIRFCHDLKSMACPHCHASGTLILHGFLRGYSETDSFKRLQRGRRFFCNNRSANRKGCGRTFSLFLACFIKNFIVQTSSLWRFLENLHSGLNIHKAFRQTGLPISNTSIYRLHGRLKNIQPYLRSHLNRITLPPHSSSREPLIQTIRHLRSAFRVSQNPLMDFQSTFQASCLA